MSGQQTSSSPTQILAITHRDEERQIPQQGRMGDEDNWSEEGPSEHAHSPTGSYDGSYTTLDPMTDNLSGYGSGTNEGASTVQPVSMRHGSPRRGPTHRMLSTLPSSTQDGEYGDDEDDDDDTFTDGGSTLHSEVTRPTEVYPLAPTSACSQTAPRGRSVQRQLFTGTPLGGLRQSFATPPHPADMTFLEVGEECPQEGPVGANEVQSRRASPPKMRRSPQKVVQDIQGKWGRRAQKFLRLGKIVVSGPNNTLPSPQRLHAQARRNSPDRPGQRPQPTNDPTPTHTPPLTPIRHAHPQAATPEKPATTRSTAQPEKTRPKWGCFGKLQGCFRGQS